MNGSGSLAGLSSCQAMAFSKAWMASPGRSRASKERPTLFSASTFRGSSFEQCLKLEPRNVEAENNVGLSFEALDRPGEAIQAFENAIAWQEESPAKDPEPFIELAHLYL